MSEGDVEVPPTNTPNIDMDHDGGAELGTRGIAETHIDGLGQGATHTSGFQDIIVAVVFVLQFLGQLGYSIYHYIDRFTQWADYGKYMAIMLALGLGFAIVFRLALKFIPFPATLVILVMIVAGLPTIGWFTFDTDSSKASYVGLASFAWAATFWFLLFPILNFKHIKKAGKYMQVTNTGLDKMNIILTFITFCLLGGYCLLHLLLTAGWHYGTEGEGGFNTVNGPIPARGISANKAWIYGIFSPLILWTLNFFKHVVLFFTSFGVTGKYFESHSTTTKKGFIKAWTKNLGTVAMGAAIAPFFGLAEFMSFCFLTFKVIFVYPMVAIVNAIWPALSTSWCSGYKMAKSEPPTSTNLDKAGDNNKTMVIVDKIITIFQFATGMIVGLVMIYIGDAIDNNKQTTWQWFYTFWGYSTGSAVAGVILAPMSARTVAYYASFLQKPSNVRAQDAVRADKMTALTGVEAVATQGKDIGDFYGDIPEMPYYTVPVTNDDGWREWKQIVEDCEVQAGTQVRHVDSVLESDMGTVTKTTVTSNVSHGPHP